MGITHLIGLTAIMLIVGFLGLILIKDNYKPHFALLIVLINAIITSIPAVLALTESTQTGVFTLPHLLGNIIVRVDSLSAWFILIINFTSINGVLYGSGYLKSYTHLKVNRQLHWVFYILFHSSMLWVCMFEQGVAFLISWELMSLSSLLLVIFEYQHKDTIKAGINYMVQMHISVLFLTLGFIWLFVNTGSFNFSALAQLPIHSDSLWIFLLLFAGFAIKAGFVPFHTWLPQAHPAAPSHISGVMSGVIVKLGIYGILRIITHLQQDWLLIGEVILCLSVLTSIYGIANAAVRNDFKQMLAFCTIENIGIIGIGIGLGLIGMGKGNTALIILGFGGALLHTLNHSLFKSLLFFSAGSVYQQTHSRRIEHLGGLIKKMPVTAVFFLIGALSIVGLPPFNGFISEYLIYSGLFTSLSSSLDIPHDFLFIISIAGLAIVGGISLLTFTKNFGVIFLGNPRKEFEHTPKETSFGMHLPQYLIILVMLSVALFPQFYFSYASNIVLSVFSPYIPNHNMSTMTNMVGNITMIGHISLLFIILILLIFGLRFLLVRKRETTSYETWGCGYIAPIPKAQYTGRSFSRHFGQLFSFLVKEKKIHSKSSKTSLYPKKYTFTTYYFDLLDEYIITPLVRRLNFTLNYFQFIQNGQIQSYVIYGLFFIVLVFLGSAFNLIN